MSRYVITEECVACDFCRSACPEGAILPGPHLYGCGRETCRGCPAASECEMQIPAIRGPYVIDRGRCTGCGDCVATCLIAAIVVEQDDAA